MRSRVVVPCLALFLLSSSLLSCATKPRGPATEPAPPPARIKDSPPEKRAALRNADPQTGAEGDEERWGVEAARERKQQSDEKERAKKQAAESPAPLPTGPFDIRAKSQKPAPGPATDKPRAP